MKRHLLARQARGAAAPLAVGLLATTLLAVAAGPASARAGTLPAPSRRPPAGWLTPRNPGV